MHRIRKVSVALVVILIVSLVMASCAPTPTAPTKPIKLRYTNSLASKHNVSLDQKWWAEQVGKKAEGKVIVEVYQGGELYKATQTVDAVTTGAVEMGVSSIAQGWPGRNPVFDATQYWFLIRDYDQWAKVVEKARAVMWPLHEALGAKPLHFFYAGQGGIISRVPVKKPADLKGLLIRGPVKGDFECLEALGATPARIPSAEVYDALAKGTVDGARSGFGTFNSRKWYEAAKYVIGPTQLSVWVVCMNLNFWNSLPKDIQDVIMKVSKEAEERNFKTAQGYDRKSLEILKQQLEVHMFTAGESKEWVTRIEPVYNAWLQKCEKAGYGTQARKIYDALVK